MEPECPAKVKLRWWWWLALVLGLAGLGLLGMLRPVPTVVILPFEKPSPTPLHQALQYGWAWLQFHLPGKHPNVLVRAGVYALGQTPLPNKRPFGEPAASADGTRIWVLSKQEVGSANRWLVDTPGAERISQPGIQTASGMGGAMTAGNTVTMSGKPQFIGVSLDLVSKVHQGHVDLASAVRLTELVTNQVHVVSVRTNLAVRTRIQVPDGGGALLLSDGGNGKPAAVVLTVSVR